MIRKLSHASIYVLDQDRALEFYRDKLGLQVHTDAKMGNFRWLTLHAKDQPDFEIVLMPIAPGPLIDEKSASSLRELVKAGAFGVGVFETDDVKRDYEELKRKGVEFRSPPAERHYGIEAVVRDNSGNWFSLTQRNAAAK
jgi:catechol 2,3-dioxygenase-like lactoylglutathione lyase family enzyme